MPENFLDLIKMIAKRLGASQQGPVYANERVDVTAPIPTMPYPSNMDEIMLGTRTRPPIGTWLPPDGQTKVTSMPEPLLGRKIDGFKRLLGPTYKQGSSPTTEENERLSGVLESFLFQYPYAGRSTAQAFVDPTIENTRIRGQAFDKDLDPEGAIGINRRLLNNVDDTYVTLGHEFGHNAQQDATMGKLDPWRTRIPGASNFYLGSVGEDQARAIETAIIRRLLGGK